MNEVIGAVVGAIFGALFTWLLTRKRATYLICDEKYSGVISLSIPEAAVTYQGKVVSELGYLRLELRNTGRQVIENPEITLTTSKDVTFLNASAKVSPERFAVTNGDIQAHSVQILLDRSYPYSQNGEIVAVDIFADQEIKHPNVFGNGVMKDGTGWSIKPRAQGVVSERRTKLAQRLNQLVIPYVLVGGVYLFFFRPPVDILNIQWQNAIVWASDPAILVLILCLIAWILWSIYLLAKGHYLYIPIVLLKRELRFFLERS